MAAASDGKLWLVGGQTESGVMGDVWSFDPTSNAWAFEAGSQTPVEFYRANWNSKRVPAAGNLMPSRWMFGAAMDKHAGVIFLSGGMGTQSEALGDVWSFNVTSKLFTWIAGEPADNAERGIYPAVKGIDGGELIVSRPNNYAGNAWVDASGGLWLGMGIHRNVQLQQDHRCNGTTTRARAAVATASTAAHWQEERDLCAKNLTLLVTVRSAPLLHCSVRCAAQTCGTCRAASGS
jgi:hypothetical protein